MYKDFCQECGLEMSRLSRDGLQIICDGCFVPKPVPHDKLPTYARLAEVRRLKTFQAGRIS